MSNYFLDTQYVYSKQLSLSKIAITREHCLNLLAQESLRDRIDSVCRKIKSGIKLKYETIIYFLFKIDYIYKNLNI